DLLEQAAARATFGKKEPALAAALEGASPETLLPIGVWLDTIALGFDPRLDLVARLEGARTMPDVNAALAASAALHASAMRSGVTGPFAAAAAAQGFEVRFVGDHVPVVYLTGPASLLAWLEERPEVVSIHLEREASLELDRSVPTIRADRVWSGPTGVTGVGAIATDIEGGGITNLNPYLPSPILYQAAPGAFSSHATAIGGMIASDHPVDRGVAWGATLYSANLSTSELNTISGMNWAVANGTHVANVSLFLGQLDPPILNLSDRAFDYIIRSTGRLMVKSAGNQGGGTSFVTSPGRGWNMLTVGNLNDANTVVWGDDTMSSSSSWVDPATGVQKPEVAAPGTSINSTTLASPWVGATGSGTSYAAPHALGTACLLYERDPQLAAWPEAIKAILMASAWHNVEGAALFSDKDGAGALHAWAADQVVQRGTNGYVRGILTPASFTAGQFDLPFPLQRNNRARVALSWDSVAAGPPGYATDALAAAFDLVVLDPLGATVASATHPFSSFRILEFVPALTGIYTVRLQQTLFTGASEPYAVAVSQYFDTNTNAVSGAVPLPIGVTTALSGEDVYHAGSGGFVVLGLSGVSDGNGYVVGDHTVPIVDDGAFLLPLQFPALFPGFAGTLSATGTQSFSVAVPNLPSLVGLTLSFSFVTLVPSAPLGVGEISPGVSATIVP
ncbi:MAG TPA: S8 family serine peptidase, partial [Planctomycetota bacterium]|nr:S8 family serine peptidase [Planctomycetota bacterium]